MKRASRKRGLTTRKIAAKKKINSARKMAAKKKVAAKKKIVPRKKVTRRTNTIVKSRQNHINALQYLVDSEEKGIRLMIANSMGLIPEG